MTDDDNRIGDDLDHPIQPLNGDTTPPDWAGGELEDHMHYSPGLVVLPSTVDLPGYGVKPAVVFRFATPEGGFYPPIALVTDDDQMAKLRPLLFGAIQMARRAAKTTPSAHHNN